MALAIPIKGFAIKELIKKAGMKAIEFSKGEAKHWAETSNSALWAHFKKAMSSSDYAQARKLMGYK